MHHLPGPFPLLRGTSLALVACLALAAPVMAAHGPARLGLTPIGESGPYFAITMEPGESRQLQVEVANFGHDDLLARTYASDGYTMINGGFAADLADEPTSGTTDWLDYPAREVTLGPGQGLIVDFSVSVPEGTPPGEYITALVAENVEPYRAGDQQGMTFEQVNRTVVAVAIEVPGPAQPSLTIGGVSHKSAAGISFVIFELSNDGNRHLKPAGEFTLYDAAGTELHAATPVLDSVYAGTRTLVETPLPEPLAPGDYCAELTLTDEPSGAADATACLPVIVSQPTADPGAEAAPALPIVQPALDVAAEHPLTTGLGALGLGTLAALLYVYLRRRRRRAAVDQRTAPVWPQADTETVAEPTGVSVRGSAEAALIQTIRGVKEIRRAWMIRHDDHLELVLEGAPDADVATGSRIAGLLQSSVGQTISGVPFRVVFLGGAGIVARRTSGLTPLYAAHRAD